jgi:hypothetical protein
MQRQRRSGWRIVTGRLAGWLAAVAAVPVGRDGDGLTWAQGEGRGPADRAWGDLAQEMTDALAAWRQNPLARRLVGMITAYVVGNGITLRSSDPALQAFLTAFWQVNRMDLRLADWCDELTRAGEIFPIIFTNPVDGMSQVRLAPAAQIERIEWRAGDYETELAYHEVRRWDGEPQVWVSPWHERAADLATPVMLHYAVNRPIGALRGESDLAPLLPWLRRYTRWLEDRVRLNAGVRAFLWVVRAPARLRTALVERYRTPPEAGSVIIADPDETWEAVAPNLHASDASADGRAIRWMIVAGGLGASLLDLGEGEDSNLATARAMSEMRHRFLRRRQAYLGWLLADLSIHAYHRWAAAAPGRAGQQATVADVQVDAPDIAVEDNAALAQAAASLAKGMTDLAGLVGNGPALRRLAVRLFIKFAGEEVTEAEIEAMLAGREEVGSRK